MKVKDSWFVEQRAVQLAIVYLSRRNDLLITQPRELDYGIDILVNIVKDGQITGRMFGVEIKASKELQVTPIIPAKNEFRVKVVSLKVLEDLPFPLCLFAFNMENDDGYYRWLLEPIVDSDNKAKLELNKGDSFKKLTHEELDGIVEKINQWYETRIHS